jgi:esterase/lipase
LIVFLCILLFVVQNSNGNKTQQQNGKNLFMAEDLLSEESSHVWLEGSKHLLYD